MNSKIKQFIAFGVCSVVALILCIGVLVVTVNNLDSDAIATKKKTVINKTELDSSKDTLVEYINTLVYDTEDRFVKTKTYTEISVNDIKALNPSENQGKDEALLVFAKDKMLSEIDSFYSDDSEGTFENNNSQKLALVLNKTLLKNANFSIGQVDESGKSVFDDEGNLVDSEYYYLTYKIDIENETYKEKISEMFSVKDDALAKEQFIDAVKDDCRIELFDAKPESFIIKAKVDRSNDEIQYINLIRNYDVTLDATFINNAEFFGEKQISFIYTVTDTYEYSYAGISFIEDEITIGFDDEYMLNVNAVIDNDSEYTVEFISSDEDVAIIDEMGYVKGVKNCDVPVTITVKLSYLGETFTDTCIVNVSAEEGGAVNE
ncbi:MAG: hypothetical protein E7529_04800 [Ruminococcaceae bacterium]|nr:hypothetical protein [Oscillospiraceae bacterium]